MMLARWLSVDREASLHSEASSPMLSSRSNRLFSLWPSSEDPEEGGQILCTGSPWPFPSDPGLLAPLLLREASTHPALGPCREGEGGTGYLDSMSSFTLYTRPCFQWYLSTPSGRIVSILPFKRGSGRVLVVEELGKLVVRGELQGPGPRPATRPRQSPGRSAPQSAHVPLQGDRRVAQLGWHRAERGLGGTRLLGRHPEGSWVHDRAVSQAPGGGLETGRPPPCPAAASRKLVQAAAAAPTSHSGRRCMDTQWSAQVSFQEARARGDGSESHRPSWPRSLSSGVQPRGRPRTPSTACLLRPLGGQ
ncbi:uncharacterized protein LOC112586669 [Bubalus bubalis]|uniref:uncharacterized protein LOC112586669 n=1 Tax=Bubalus bubalis TaxID=89462 RepID=UPI001E1B9BCC|nr:uncharacterized protein LOC112586669 [Bubalus bubalis]XP_044802964.2 uncharacterized protein LOC112586669 [Bubalus bubalis]XP_044802965.2 uncharacterized protein LOC112586669 [Bubalus bubalis]